MRSSDPRAQRTFTIRRSVLEAYLAYCHDHGEDPNRLVEEYMECIARGGENGLAVLIDHLRAKIRVLEERCQSVALLAEEKRRVVEASLENRGREEYKREVERQRLRLASDPRLAEYLDDVVERLSREYHVLPEHVRMDLS